MMARTSRKIPVTERQFLWVQDDDKGEVTPHVGRTMVSPTAAGRVVIDDGQGGFREDTSSRPQSIVELGDTRPCKRWCAGNLHARFERGPALSSVTDFRPTKE